MARLKDKAAKLYARGRYGKAVLAYRQVVNDNPRDMNSRLRLGDAYRRLERADKALACYREVADFYAKDGMLLKAIAACKLVLNVDSKHAETQSLLADLYAQRYGQDELEPPAVASPKSAPENEAASPAVQPPLSTAQNGGSTGSSEIEGAGLDSASQSRSPSRIDQDLDSSDNAGAAHVESSHAACEEVELASEDELFVVHAGEHEDEVEIALDDMDDDIDVSDIEPPRPPPEPESRPSSLPTIPLFSELDRSAFIELLERMDHRELAPDEIIVREGERGSSFFVVISGTLRVTREVDGEVVRLAELKEGHFFGEMALLSTRPRQATVKTVTSAEIFEIDKQLLEDLTSRHQSVKDALQRFYRRRLLGNLFATSPIFRPFDKEERKRLMDHFMALEVGPGELVLRENGVAEGLFVVLSGELVALRGSGFEEITLGRLSEGDVFGEMSLLSREPPAATVKTLTSCVVLRLPKESFESLAMSHPQILETVSRLSETRRHEIARVLDEMSATLDDGGLDDDPLMML